MGVLVFTIGYICGGLVLIGGTLGLLMQSVIDRAEGAPPRPLWLSVSLSLALFTALVCVGACGICAFEGWSALSGVYWAVVTLATVGYGGEVPSSEGSRAFASAFMLLGVGCTGKIFSDFSAIPLAAHRRALERKVLRQYGDELDEEALWELAAGSELATLGLSASDEYVDRNEFVLAMLVRMGKISTDDLREVRAPGCSAALTYPRPTRVTLPLRSLSSTRGRRSARSTTSMPTGPAGSTWRTSPRYAQGESESAAGGLLWNRHGHEVQN